MFSFTKDIGMDLGTASVLIYIKDKGIVLNEPSVVALDKNTGKLLKVGADAQAMLGRTPGNIIAIRPLREGVISDYEVTERMIKEFLHKVIGFQLFKPRIIICVPSGITEVEERAVVDAGIQAGARRVYLIEEPVAAAIGAGIDISKPDGHMVVDIGGGTTEVAVISLGGIVVSRSVRVGGIRMDAAIINFIKREFNMLIGDRTAEDVKFDLGAALPMNDVRRAFVRGRDLVTNLPQTAEITSTMVYEALKAPCQAILAAIQYVLERTPPELAGDVMRSGIHLTGGGALLCGMDRFIATELDMPVLLAKEPMDCAALGIGQLAEDLELLQRMCQSAPQRDDEEETTF